MAKMHRLYTVEAIGNYGREDDESEDYSDENGMSSEDDDDLFWDEDSDEESVDNTMKPDKG